MQTDSVSRAGLIEAGEFAGGKLVDPNRQRGLNWGEIIEELYGVAERVITWETARKRCIGAGIVESRNRLPENKTTCDG